MNNLRKNEGLAQDIYTTLNSGVPMYIGRDYFGDGISYMAGINPTLGTVTIQKLDRHSSNLVRDLGKLQDVTPETIEAALNDMDGVHPMVRLSADIFVDLMCGVVQKTYPVDSGFLVVSVSPQNNQVNYQHHLNEGRKAVAYPHPVDQPAVLAALKHLFND